MGERQLAGHDYEDGSQADLNHFETNYKSNTHIPINTHFFTQVLKQSKWSKRPPNLLLIVRTSEELWEYGLRSTFRWYVGVFQHIFLSILIQRFNRPLFEGRRHGPAQMESFHGKKPPSEETRIIWVRKGRKFENQQNYTIETQSWAVPQNVSCSVKPIQIKNEKKYLPQLANTSKMLSSKEGKAISKRAVKARQSKFALREKECK